MIELQNVQKVVANQTLVDIPELRVSEGQAVALIGPAGSGTETLFSLLIGQTRPTLGRVRVCGFDPASERGSFSRHTGVLFSEDGLYERQTAKANLAFYCRLYGVDPRRADQVLRQVGLADQGGESVAKLSGSLKRRLAFGRAILHEPKVLILSDPFTRCDSNSIDLLLKLVQDAVESGTAILVLSDDTTHMDNFCHAVHKLEKGRVVESYHPQDAPQDSIPFKIPVRLDGKVVLVNPVDILYADASEGKAILTTQESRLPTPFTLSELEMRLQRRGFFRTHRSYLVNLQHVKEVIPYTRNSFSLRLDDPQETVIPLSKTAAGELKELLGF